MVACGGSFHPCIGGMERHILTDLSEVARTRGRPDGTSTIAQSCYGFLNRIRLFSLHSLFVGLQLVLASSKPPQPRDTPLPRVRKLVGGHRDAPPSLEPGIAIRDNATSCVSSARCLRLGSSTSRKTSPKDTMRTILECGCNC